MPFVLNRDTQTHPNGNAAWQFYARPTNLEPPGTIFRIDASGHRSIVDRLELTVTRATEPQAAAARTADIRADTLSRFLGLEASSAAGAHAVWRLTLEIAEPERQSASDAKVEQVLAAFLPTMEFRAGFRYYMVRESRSAVAVTFQLTEEQRRQIAGDAAIALGAKWGLTATKTADGLTRLTRTFVERVGIMFLPDEITQVRAGLAGGAAALGRVPAHGGLDWIEPEYAVVRVFYATDRGRTDSEAPAGKYGSTRGAMTYGTCDVSIPRDHRMGDLEAPSILKLQFREDPARHVVLLSVVDEPKAAFFAGLEARVSQSPTKSAFLFIHGYNVTFEDAARRTAQIAYDLTFDGAPVLYSWPSQGSLAGYTVDETNIEWTQPDLQQLLSDVFEQSGTRQLYVIAHSMGNRAMTRVVAALLAVNPALRGSLKEVILAAPDIDADVFKRDIVPALTAPGRPVTLYASSTDLALAASKAVHGYPRAGDAGANLIVVPGVETIDASAVDTGLIRHAYFAEARSVLSDIYALVGSGRRAADRLGLRAIDTREGRHWQFNTE